VDTHRLSSSLRSRSAEDSLAIAESVAKSRGISRVTDTTWLDRIGVPVYASIRPNGIKGTLCVHAGKGFTHAEAKVGAYMEAIEFSFSVPCHNIASSALARPPEIRASFKNRISFADFPPIAGNSISSSDQIAIAEGEEILSQLGNVCVPAELVYYPFFGNPGRQLYGTSTNGLASGNTLQEATVHGLAEVMERDVASFNYLDDRSALVDLRHAPPKIKTLAEKAQNANLICHLRYIRNSFGLPYFSAYLLEPDESALLSLTTGHGLHPIKEIAAVRAITEAMQSRLTNIHGGRDDLIENVKDAEALGPEKHLEHVRGARAIAASAVRIISFNDIPDFEFRVRTVAQAEECLFEGLSRAGMNHVVRVRLTEPDYPFQVVRILVPGAEHLKYKIPRAGPRLLRYFTDNGL
jgi:ribosomal protein S12 methylthiotransferase accessory factor